MKARSFVFIRKPNTMKARKRSHLCQIEIETEHKHIV